VWYFSFFYINIIFSLQDAGAVCGELKKHSDLHVKYNLRVQPVLVVVGSETVEEVAVYVNNIKYLALNIVRGLDMLFKTYMALNLEYSCENKNVLLFIQLHIFEIHTKYDKLSPSICSLMKMLSKSC